MKAWCGATIPDHCDILGTWLTDEDALMPVFGRNAPVPVRTIVRPAICSIAGGVLMVSDKVEVYQDDRNIEGLKRSSPVLPDRARSALRSRPRGGDLVAAGDRPAVRELVRFEPRPVGEETGDRSGSSISRALPQQEVKFADLGLDTDREYVVFEFWTQKFLGKSKGSFTAPAMDENNGLQVFAIREARPHPWVLSTTRHISQGGVSLLDERWDAGHEDPFRQERGGRGDPYVLTVHLPDGYRLVARKPAARRSRSPIRQRPPRSASCPRPPRRWSGR